MKRIVAATLAMLATTSCSTIDKNLALAPDATEAIVLVTGAPIGSIRTGYGFRSFDPGTKIFGGGAFTVYEGYTSDALHIKDEGGASKLKRVYYLQRVTPGNYVRTMDLWVAPGLASQRTAFTTRQACLRSGAVYPVVAGKVTIIDLSGKAPDDQDVAAFETDYRTFVSAYPNITAPMQISRPIGTVEFYGKETIEDLNAQTAACPQGVSNYQAGDPTK
jgi:hypothetical protein